MLTGMAHPLSGKITPAHVEAIKAALATRDDAQRAVELAVAQALLEGASVRQVVEASGLANVTVQKYGHRHGWPTAEYIAEREATQRANREFAQRLDAAARAIRDNE